MAERAELQRIRRLLLLVLAGAMLGLLTELVLLEHYESRRQWIPLATLALGLLAVLWMLLRPGRAALRLLRTVMLAMIAVSGLGMYFHFSGNREFELERAPELRGGELVWESLTGATPALAPGTLVLLGLIGLVATYRQRPGERD